MILKKRELISFMVVNSDVIIAVDLHWKVIRKQRLLDKAKQELEKQLDLLSRDDKDTYDIIVNTKR